MAAVGKDISYALDLLNSAEPVAVPTETVYGLAANAYDAQAVAKIFKVKNRPSFDPLIVHTSDVERIKEFIAEIPEKALLLAEAFWPGPLTMILKKKAIIPDLVTSGLETAAVRIPDHELTLGLLRKLDFPVAAPSANPFGYISPTAPGHVNEQLGNKIKYILDGGICRVGIESTIVGFDGDQVRVLRLGGCRIEAIERVVGKVISDVKQSSVLVAPGMTESHYAPLTPLKIGNIDELIKQHSDKKLGILAFDALHEGVAADRQFVLSEKGDTDEAATSLFSGLRQLDMLNLHLIISEYVPEVGLGRAVNDRLKRASVKRN